MLVITTYLTREILKPFAFICGVLLLLMVSYSAVGYLADAASSLIPVNLLAALIFAKTVAAFELFLPLGLYITLLMGLGKLYSEQEISALHASGMSVFGLVRSLLPLIIIVTIATAIVSLYMRPWAYDLRYDFKYQAEDTHDFDRLESGYFYENQEAGTVYFVKQAEQGVDIKRDVFVHETEEEFVRIINADKSYTISNSLTRNPVVVFLDGTAYQHVHDGVDTVVRFNRLTILPKQNEAQPREFKRKAAATSVLAKSQMPDEIAEYQWRITSAVKTFLLALIAIYLAKTSPRHGRYGKLVLGVLLFFLVHGASLVLKSSIEQGSISAVPGMWYVVIGLTLITFYMAKKES